MTMTVPPPAPPPGSPGSGDFEPPELPEWVEDLGQPVDPEVAEAERKRALRDKIEKSAKWHEVDQLGKILGKQRAAKAANELVNGRHVKLRRASSYPTLATRWMWAGRIPVGEITLVCGREGVGKSTWFAWLAAQVTRGALEGHWHGRPRDVWYVATEDSWSHTIKPRMEAAGADLRRVHHLLVDVEEVGLEKPVLPLDVRHVVAEVHRVRGLLAEARDHGWRGDGGEGGIHPDAGDPAMLMLDPAISVIDEKINAFNAKELRTALEPLKAAADACDIAVVGLAHFNKTKDADVMTMVAGARAWVEVARAVIAIAVDKEADEYTCVLSQIKNNLGRSDLPNLAYTLDSVPVRTSDGGTTEVGAVRWLGESGRSAEELLGERGVPGPARGEAYEKVVDHVTGAYRATGSLLSLRDIVNHFGRDLTEANVKKILRRAVQRGDLLSPVRSMYGPPADSGPVRATAEVSRCVMPGCGNVARVGRPMCADCESDLDSQDKKLRSVQDPLWESDDQEG